ncbi:hypothetical protein [Actinomadura sp. 6N118]|uniref:hypothetical protein n=1 Tax=Actinomadura sp. 6N118 TaxID=3375151 RepID=UPI0037B3A8DB
MACLTPRSSPQDRPAVDADDGGARSLSREQVEQLLARPPGTGTTAPAPEPRR